MTTDKQGYQDLQENSQSSRNADQVSPSQIELGRILGQGGFSDGSQSAAMDDIYRTTSPPQEDEFTRVVPRNDALVVCLIIILLVICAHFGALSFCPSCWRPCGLFCG
jgi:hypothetical protein